MLLAGGLQRLAVRGVPRRRLGVTSSLTSAQTVHSRDERGIWEVQPATTSASDQGVGVQTPGLPTSPPPKWSFHGRPLPSNLIGLSSPMGRRIFKETLNKSEVGYCGSESVGVT